MAYETHFSKVAGKSLKDIISEEQSRAIAQATAERGAQIVSCLGQGSAYYAPSAAAFSMVKAILNDEKKVVPACVFCSGQYGVKDVCIGVPVSLGAQGAENIVELVLTVAEKQQLSTTAQSIKEAVANLL